VGGEKIYPVLIVKEHGTPLDPSDDDMLNLAGDLFTDKASHGVRISEKLKISRTPHSSPCHPYPMVFILYIWKLFK
jgi:hypothetical protein